MLSKATEIKLIAQCLIADDRNAFGQLVDAYAPRVKRFLMNLTGGDAYLTDDLSQETFIKAYINLRAFKGLSSFSTWLYRIAYNEYYTERRRHGEVGEEQIAPANEPMAATGADDGLAALDVEVALRALSDEERAVVTLFYIDDQPLKRVATITGLPVGTVKSHLHRAKAKMARYIEQ